jgi:MoaA/NifB/PqqE/SkfB family radical SAM enzyme
MKSVSHSSVRPVTAKVQPETPRTARACGELVANFLIDLLCVHARVRWIRPLITNFYVTKRCNLRCRYCYPPGDEPSLSTGELLSLLEKIRPHNPAINFTGGEPLLCEGIEQLLIRAGELAFHPVILSTNGMLAERLLPLLKHVRHLVISLDSLDAEVNDRMTGVPGTTSQVIQTVMQCAALASRQGFHMSVHTVLAPETLSGVSEMVSFCTAHHATLSVSPEHGRYDPHDGLHHDPRYRVAVDDLIRMKREGKPIASSIGYLKRIRDFPAHRCYPFVSPRVEPDGRVYFPCQRIAGRAVYLQDYRTLAELMRREFEWMDREECRRRCFLACYLEVDEYLHHPLTLLREVNMRQWLSGRNGRTPDAESV